MKHLLLFYSLYILNIQYHINLIYFFIINYPVYYLFLLKLYNINN